MANHVLGEVEVKIKDRTFTLRPTFEAVCELEARSRLTLAEMVNKMAVGKFGLSDVAAIVWAGMLGAAEKNKDVPNFNDLGRMIMEDGYTKLAPACGKFVGAAYSGKPIEEIGVSKLKEAQPASPQSEPEQKT